MVFLDGSGNGRDGLTFNQYSSVNLPLNPAKRMRHSRIKEMRFKTAGIMIRSLSLAIFAGLFRRVRTQPIRQTEAVKDQLR